MSQNLAILAIAAALSFPTPSPCADDSPLRRGTREVGLSGTVVVTHDSPQDLFGVVSVRGGYYVRKNQQIGADATVFAYSRIQDTYLSGFYRYSFAKLERRLTPYVGVAAGTNVGHFDQFGTERSLILKAQGGLRFFVGTKSSLDVGYDLMYRRNTEVGFTGPTSSVVTFGFSRVF